MMLEISESNSITLVVDPDESRSTVGHKNGIFSRTGGLIGLKFFWGIPGDALCMRQFMFLHRAHANANFDQKYGILPLN